MRFATIAVISCLLILASPASAQEADSTQAGLTERVEVALVLLEALVVDAEGRSVDDLAASDFQLSIDGTVKEISSVDKICPAGGLPDVDAASTVPPPAGPRRIAIVVDYYHLSQRDRVRVLDQAQEMIRAGMADGEQVMVAALADGLRVEQRFTDDPAEVVDALHRMEFDVSLFARDFSGATGKSYLDGLSSLMDVLAQYDQAKAVVFVSSLLARGDLYENWFYDVAERAASARTVIYPGMAQWMQNPEPRMGTERRKGSTVGQRVLPRLAIESGGRMPPRSDDISLAYAMAQRDLACRYTVGYRIDRARAMTTQKIELTSGRAGSQLSYPTRIRLWSEEERRASRLRAAFVDPERFETPLVRTLVYPLRPGSNRKSWETVAAIHFPMPVGSEGAELDLTVTMTREGKMLADRIERKFHVPAATDGSGRRPVTLLGDSTLKAGSHTLTVALTSPDVDAIATTQVTFEVPQVPSRGSFIRGPILARVVPRGVLIRADQEEDADDTALDEILGEDETFEPLLVHRLPAADDLLVAWMVCSDGKQLTGGGARVDRRIVGDDDATLHTLDPVALELQGEGKLRCHGALDRVAGGTLAPGDVRLEVALVDSGGETLVAESRPLGVE